VVVNERHETYKFLHRKSKQEKKRMELFKFLKKEVEIGANGTQSYIIKKGVNKGKKATK
jgi:hypothetical protein